MMKTAPFALAAMLMAGAAVAQTPPAGGAARPTPGNTAPGATGNAPMPGVNPNTGTTPQTGAVDRNSGTAAAAGDRNQGVATTSANAPQPARGRNSFTEGEARRRIERNGYQNVNGLKKDDGGVWRGTATKNGTSEDVWLDYKGNVGPHPTPASTRSNTSTSTSTGTNAPGTAAGRAVDRTLGTGTTTGTGTTMGTSPAPATPAAPAR